MPAILVLDERDTLAFDSFGNNQCWCSIWLDSLSKCLIDLFIIVSIDGDGIPAESVGACSISLSIPAQLSLATLAQPIAIKNRNHII